MAAKLKKFDDQTLAEACSDKSQKQTEAADNGEMERRRGQDRRKFAYLSGPNRRRKKERRNS